MERFANLRKAVKPEVSGPTGASVAAATGMGFTPPRIEHRAWRWSGFWPKDRPTPPEWEWSAALGRTATG